VAISALTGSSVRQYSGIDIPVDQEGAMAGQRALGRQVARKNGFFNAA
jgi:hypothetical protein